MKRTIKISPFERLFIVLTWLKSGCSQNELALLFNIDVQFIRRDIWHIIPILVEKIRLIHLFDEEFLLLFSHTIGDINFNGVIDATCHRRDRLVK